MSDKSLVIIGTGGHAVSAFNVALSAGFRVSHFVGRNQGEGQLLRIPVVDRLEDAQSAGPLNVFIAIGDNELRSSVHHEITATNPELLFPALVHETAVISAFSQVGEGTVVMPGAVIGPNTRVGRHCIVNTRASIDHDSDMSDFSSLAPAATTGGRVRIGLRSAISIGAVIRHGIAIGDDCIVGASSYLNADLPSNKIAYGTPARIIRERIRGEPYL
jgi:sugar O-acyltransferase (sialic acid O-acetyltransferase NeuD family)